ncbi:uncharacterized protein LOC103505875 [Diaphorina citri]|uniref:Uncharacterized protein LOC103505875 n=1 Tax=Diaphorina citri TaxID=121845 RepID=A0A1S3CWJ5_DIACI|nr:uncharacterized protein LOC103505875 [Diaphorina citri]KAI5703522.1 hypothetical protein M8J75_012820 [Diaphorina citri]KAI5733174.1 hypothetical protein M8J76_008561 [Diaphorina citri]KAI5739929.1 hypothetical protein M8J77_025148 [Diaphorina citri]
MNSVLFLFPVLFTTFCFLISCASTENQQGYDSKNPPWNELFEPFEPEKSKLTTPPALYKRIFKSAWNKIFRRPEKSTKDRYHCLKRKASTIHVVVKYFHYTFTMRKPTGLKIKHLFTKLPFVAKLFEGKSSTVSSSPVNVIA